MPTRKPLRIGMVGGGPGAFIGPVHLMAARLDGETELVCGAFSSDPRSRTPHNPGAACEKISGESRFSAA